MRENYDWVMKCIISINSPFQLDAGKKMIDLFEEQHIKNEDSQNKVLALKFVIENKERTLFYT